VLALWIISGIIAVFVLVLLIPVDFVFGFKTEDQAAGRARVEWLFGAVRKTIGGKNGKPAARNRRSQILARLRNRSMLSLGRRLLRALKVHRLNGVVRLGLDDPASTGMAYGIAQLFLACVPLPPGSDFRIEPDFCGLTFEADVEGRVRVYPLRVLGIMLAYLFSREGRHAVRKMATAR
jgi:hypothetical protein